MANVSFGHDYTPKPPLDGSLEEVGATALQLGKPIRCRLQPDLYRPGPNQAYTTWVGLTWVCELEDVEEGRRLREGLTHFFRVFGADAKRQGQLLTALERLAVGIR